LRDLPEPKAANTPYFIPSYYSALALSSDLFR